ncbi:hypothetical protein KSS87_001479 [Heliosperma pusillum]|nr:hypothetical protein KSS87_001479 [Heliosperma pusillum]
METGKLNMKVYIQESRGDGDIPKWRINGKTKIKVEYALLGSCGSSKERVCKAANLIRKTLYELSNTRPDGVEKLVNRRDMTNDQAKICLEDWWLSRPKNQEGIVVSGRPIEIRKCDDAGTSFNPASPPMRRYAAREFHSAKVVKRHGATMLETCDGFLISLCGFINKSRTQENGFTSDCEGAITLRNSRHFLNHGSSGNSLFVFNIIPLGVCRDFIYGFPFNWDDYTAQSADEELKTNESTIGSFTPDVLDSFNGAQLHDFVLSLTDTESNLFIERIKNNLVLNPEAEPGLIKSPKASCRSVYSLRSGSSSRQCVLDLSTEDKSQEDDQAQSM